jgi:CDP-diacylglycerol--glycerol-3-phosphate 3-phosphatidyltransferase
MAKIFSVLGRAGAARVAAPVGKALLRAGVTPDVVTLIGTGAVLVGALGFVARGHILTGLIIITLSVCTDMLDGAMARARGYSTPFGAFLDSTMDRIADAAVFGSLAFWLGNTDHPLPAIGALICLAAGQVISYAKARAQSVGFECNVGIAERAERLVIVGVGGLFYIFGLDIVFWIAIWVLAVLSLITVAQRILYVRKQAAGMRTPLGTGAPAPDRAAGAPAPDRDAGAPAPERSTGPRAADAAGADGDSGDPVSSPGSGAGT